MFRLRKLNVIKIVDSKVKKDKLLKMGFVQIQALNSVKDEEIVTNNIDYESMEYPDLKSLASQKGINTHKMKKENIIEALKEVGE